ncbi:MAG: DNA polymerase IV [Clostridiaceae bacterium]|jgi:DNA polymerase-4|nr:DNA polymerase IV [Clostridiaceae bacterium]
MKKVILHSDLNNFYASVECLNNPDLKDKFVAVCGSQRDRHGIVLAKNQAAKKMGVQTGEAIWQAQQKCPNLVIVPPNFDEYLKYSKIVRDIYYRYTDLIEPFGMDECWLDVTGSTGLFGSGKQIAYQIKEKVKNETGLTVSVGVSFNKIFAKLGSDIKKPDAVTCIEKDLFKYQIGELPASALLGVGRATAKKLKKCNINTIEDLANTDPKYLKTWFGINGVRLWQYANGLDDSNVAPFDYVSPIKSIGHGITCVSDLVSADEIWRVVLELTKDISHKLRNNELLAGGISIAIKDNSLFYKEYQRRINTPTHSIMEIAKEAFLLFRENYKWEKDIRAVTVRAINLVSEHTFQQISFMSDESKRQKREKTETAMEEICNRFGKQAVTYACLLEDLKMPANRSSQLIMPSAMYASPANKSTQIFHRLIKVGVE